jgi:hypothetical protein
VANSGHGFVTVIDANTIVHKLDNLGAALEQPRYDSADGLMYMTSSDQNAVFVYDPVKDVLVRKRVLAVLGTRRASRSTRRRTRRSSVATSAAPVARAPH